MQPLLFLLVILLLCSCQEKPFVNAVAMQKPDTPARTTTLQHKEVSDQKSWAYFLQHLPEQNGPVLDYKGEPIEAQYKKYRVLSFDVGTKDLQQCADALIRLRAEFLFGHERFAEISFQFTSGHPYSFLDYCNGKRPVPKGRSLVFAMTVPVERTYSNLRRYLDIVYAYAGTISLWAELKKTNQLAIGTVVITPGSPGHCLIITDVATTPAGEKLFKLVEGYSPAQSIYVLKNADDPSLGYWHRLSGDTIRTASYTFTSYSLRAFE